MLLSSAQVLYAGETEVANQQVTQQQGQTVTGTVTDSKGEPLIGVNVSVKGTTKGTITDVNGKFTILVPNSSAILVFSYVGYTAKDVPVVSNKTLKIALVEDTKLMDEVVVVGYGTQKKASLTSAISQIKGEEAFKDRGLTNTAVALQGEVPGLVVTRSSTRPGSEGAALKIRGDISINGSSTPLVIIDGVPGSVDELNQMNPGDIENISVLKDASAAIYGARSAAGVVLVTTKRGKKGTAKITYNGSLSTTINGIQPPITTNSQWLDMWYDAQYRDAMANNPTLTAKEDIVKQLDWWIFKDGSVLGGVDANGTTYSRDVLWNALRNGETLTLTNSGKTYRYEPNHYLMNELYGQASTKKHAINVSGGDDKFSYMASLGYSDAQSQLKVAEDGEKKYSGRLNVDYQATKLLKIETGMAYEKRDILTPSTDVGSGYFDPWFWPIYTPKGNFYDTFGNRNPVGGLVGGGQINTGYITSRNNLKATLDLSALVSGLTLSGTAGYKTVEKNIQTLKQKIQYYDWADVATTNRQSPGSLSENLNKWENKTLGGFVNYDSRFSKVHHVTGMLGVTAEEENFKSVTAARNLGPLYEGSGLVDLSVMTNGTEDTKNTAIGGQTSWGLFSYVTRLDYSFMDKYLIGFLGRRDGSSKLYPDQRWKNFYSLSGGWVISNESFMKSFEFLDFLKLRYNYGKTGNVDGIDNYESYATLTTPSSTYFGVGTLAGQTALALSKMTSSTRTWETIINHDAGLDFTFLKNRLSGSFDYFSRTNDGMFISVSYPSILGTTPPTTNNGKLRTNGWEFALNWRDKIGNVTYNIGGSLSDASTELLELTNNQNVPSPGKNVNRLIGKPLNAIYVYKTNGVFQTQTEADSYYETYYWTDATHTAVKSGNIIPAPAAKGTNRLRAGARKLVDVDGDGVITQKDLVYAGDAAPHMTFGIKAGLEWKGIDVQAFFQGVGKQSVLRSGNLYAPWVTNYMLQNSTFMGKTWTEDNPNAQFAVASRDANFNKWNYENRDVSVQNSSYIRLKSLVVGYTIPPVLTKKLSLNKVRVYFSGDDLWEWSKIKDGYDPEYGESSNNTFPFSRLLSCGLDVTF
ncbi:SusC/RagA family TonB-linked outer membrane protein [Parabacteroides sp. FAFU027]|uniref:SusC/RagA family TonB-linked outer membrane protein n=1 Tax=Parabacteroides sp. FAFU027 TaxID=2922715 RepID=UPI00397AB4D3